MPSHPNAQHPNTRPIAPPEGGVGATAGGEGARTTTEREERGQLPTRKGGRGEPLAEGEEGANAQPEGVECEPAPKGSEGKQPPKGECGGEPPLTEEEVGEGKHHPRGRRG